MGRLRGLGADPCSARAGGRVGSNRAPDRTGGAVVTRPQSKAAAGEISRGGRWTGLGDVDVAADQTAAFTSSTR
jgi:hypothetical protein